MKNRTFGQGNQGRRARARRKGTSRLFVLSALVASAAAVAPAYAERVPAAPPVRVTEQSAQALPFDIAPGSLDVVLREFGRVTGIAVTFADPGLAMIQSAGVRGLLTPEQALERLLMGTSVRATFSSATAVTLDVRGVSEVVEVVGAGPRALGSRVLTAPLRDVPQTINVIPQEVMRQQGATSLRDVLRNVAGITFQAGEGGGGLPGDNLTMRGFSAGNDMFIDGIRDPGGYSRDAFNLEQVEVAKGPSSSIAGRGSTGGAINQVTKMPSLRQAVSGTFGVGTAGYQRGTLDLNQPFAATSGAAFRLNAMWTDAGVPGRDVVENAAWGVAPSLAFGLNRPTQVSLKYQHLAQDNVPDYGLPWGASAGFPTGAFQADPPIDQSNFYGLRDYDFENIRSDVATLDVSHQFRGAATLRNVTRYSETERDSAITAPRPPNRQLQRRQMTNGNVANLTNLTLSVPQGAAARHDLVTGVEVSRERTRNQNSAQATNQPQTNIVSPDPGERPFGPMPGITGNPSETTLNMAGAYLFDTLSLGDRWQVTGGARLDVVDVDYQLTTLATGAVERLDAQDAMLSWRAGAVYKPRRNGSVYLGYGTSFNPAVDAAATGAALSTAPTAANNPNLDPEESRNYELGTKWDLAGARLSLTSALFRTEKVNARTRNANSDPFVLEGRQRIHGAEVGVSGNLTDRWTALMSYAYMDSEIEASANAAEQGQNLALTPKSTFSLWSTVQLPARVSVGGGVQYMDAVFRNATNTQSVPSYWLVNALASYRVNTHLTLRLNAQNLGDRQYVDRVGGGHYIPGPRRQVMLTSDVTF